LLFPLFRDWNVRTPQTLTDAKGHWSRIGPWKPTFSGLRNKRMKKSGQGIVRTGRGEEQPADKDRAQTAHRTDPDKSVSREATRDPELSDHQKTPGSGAMPDQNGDGSTG